MMLTAVLLTTLAAGLLNTSSARVLKSDGTGDFVLSSIEGFEFGFRDKKITVTNLSLALLSPKLEDYYPEIEVDDKWLDVTFDVYYHKSFLTVDLVANGVVKTGIKFNAVDTVYAFTLSFPNERDRETKRQLYVEQVELDMAPDSDFLEDDVKASDAFTDELCQHLAEKVQEKLDFIYAQNPAAAEKLSEVGLRQFRLLQNSGAFDYLHLPKV